MITSTNLWSLGHHRQTLVSQSPLFDNQLKSFWSLTIDYELLITVRQKRENFILARKTSRKLDGAMIKIKDFNCTNDIILLSKFGPFLSTKFWQCYIITFIYFRYFDLFSLLRMTQSIRIIIYVGQLLFFKLISKISLPCKTCSQDRKKILLELFNSTFSQIS